MKHTKINNIIETQRVVEQDDDDDDDNNNNEGKTFFFFVFGFSYTTNTFSLAIHITENNK